MSPEQQIAVIEQAIEAWNRRDDEEVAALCHPDVEIHSAVARTEGSGAYHGPDGAREWLRNNVETLDMVLGPRQFLAFRGLVLCLFEAQIRGTGSGVELKQDYGAVYEVKHGLITRMLSYDDPREAIETLLRLSVDGGVSTA